MISDSQKKLEEEIRRLKKIVGDLQHELEIKSELLKKLLSNDEMIELAKILPRLLPPASFVFTFQSVAYMNKFMTPPPETQKPDRYADRASVLLRGNYWITQGLRAFVIQEWG